MRILEKKMENSKNSVLKVQAYLKNQHWKMVDFMSWERLDLKIQLSYSGTHNVLYTGLGLNLRETFTDDLASLNLALELLQQGAEDALDDFRNKFEDSFNFESPNDFHG